MGVLVREVINYSSFWRSSTFSATVEPTIYLLAFGFGFGSLVSRVGGYDYVEFVGTGTVATAVLFSSVVPGHVRHVREVQVPAHLRRDPGRACRHRGARDRGGAVDRDRAGLTGATPMLVAMLFGLDPSPGMLLVPFIAFTAGYGWACFGIAVAGRMNSIDNFSYVMSAVITPLFLVAGTFFPIDGLPGVGAGRCHSSTRSTTSSSSCAAPCSASSRSWTSAISRFLVGFALVTWRIAIRWMTRKLIV